MYHVGPIEIIIIIGVVILPIALVVVGIIVAITVTQKEKKKHIRVTAEAQKIDAIAATGRITAEEARELKQALGPIAFTQTSRKPDIHIKIIGILNIIFSCLGLLFFGCFLLVFCYKFGTIQSGTIPWVPIACLPMSFMALFILQMQIRALLQF